MKHISETFEGDTVEEQVHNLFPPHYLNFSEVCRLFYGDNIPVEPDPDDWREADGQDEADDV
mgnify:FL=1